MDVYIVVDWHNWEIVSVHARLQGAALRRQEYLDAMGYREDEVTIVNENVRDEE